jgi:hypothetical protein
VAHDSVCKKRNHVEGAHSQGVAKAIERVNRLASPYARAVRRAIAQGNGPAVHQLLPMVDVARERAFGLRVAHEFDAAETHEVIDAHNALADLMEVVRDVAPSTTLVAAPPSAVTRR